MKSEFSENLRKLREMNGISQTELPDKLNANKSLISAYEKPLKGGMA